MRMYKHKTDNYTSWYKDEVFWVMILLGMVVATTIIELYKKERKTHSLFYVDGT